MRLYTSECILGKSENLAFAELRVEPEERQVGKLLSEQTAARADFADEQTIVIQMPLRVVQDAPRQLKSVGPRHMRHQGLGTVFGIKCRSFGLRHIGRVCDDEVKRPAADRGKKVAVKQPHSAVREMLRDIYFGNFKRRLGKVGGSDFRILKPHRGEDGEAA